MEVGSETFVLFEGLIDHPIIKLLQKVLYDKKSEKSYYKLIKELSSRNESLRSFIIKTMVTDSGKKLYKYAVNFNDLSLFDKGCLRHDLKIIEHLIGLDLKAICESVLDKDYLLTSLEEAYQKEDFVIEYESLLGSGHITIEGFISILARSGAGPFVFFPGCYIEEQNQDIKLLGVKKIPSIEWEDIYLYDRQKEALYRNTRALLEGKPYQNVLLVGASGTGKSTSVKALINMFTHEKLRMIQFQKSQLSQLPRILPLIENTGFKYILFIDDLSFEANEDEYKFLKSFIEGSINGDMKDIAFYVTSNRRHLIKEIRSDRENDIHLNDFIQEMTSLSDRFGLTLYYEALTQKEYFHMVGEMAKRESIAMEQEELETKARAFSMKHGKMSGRVASQFIKELIMD